MTLPKRSPKIIKRVGNYKTKFMKIIKSNSLMLMLGLITLTAVSSCKKEEIVTQAQFEQPQPETQYLTGEDDPELVAHFEEVSILMDGLEYGVQYVQSTFLEDDITISIEDVVDIDVTPLVNEWKYSPSTHLRALTMARLMAYDVGCAMIKFFWVEGVYHVGVYPC